MPILIGFDLQRQRARQSAPRRRRSRFGMFVVLAAMMLIYIPLQRQLVAVGAMKDADLALGRAVARCSAPIYFLDPAARDAASSASRSSTTGKCCTARELRRDRPRPRVLAIAQAVSFILALETIVDLRSRCFVPTDLLGAPEAAAPAAGDRLPRARAVRDPADHPRRRAARPLQGHATSWFYAQARTASSSAAYVILAFPYIYFSLDAGFRAIDVHTLTEASQSLGATLAHDARSRDPPEHPVGRAQRRVPDARDRDGRVHDREPRRLPHVPDLHPVHQRDARPTPRRRSRC